MLVETTAFIETTLEAIAIAGSDDRAKQDFAEAIHAKYPQMREFTPLHIDRYLPHRIERDGKLLVAVEFSYDRP